MSPSKWKLEILARRATFCAAALSGAGAGVATAGCDKSKSDSAVVEEVCLRVAGSVEPRFEPGSMGHPPELCLRASIKPASSAMLDHDYPFDVKSGDKVLAKGTLLAKVDGPDVPHAADIATGAHFRARTRNCFVDAADKGTNVEGTVRLTLEVSGDGSVAKATTEGTLDEGLRDCIAEGAKKLGFNPVEGGAESKVIVELKLTK